MITSAHRSLALAVAFLGLSMILLPLRAQSPAAPLLLRNPTISRTHIAFNYGGTVTAPRWGVYNPDTGEFDVENKGVAPDIEVDFDPRTWREGHDVQLEKAVAVALEQLKKNPISGNQAPEISGV